MQRNMRATIMLVDGSIEGSKQSLVFHSAHLHLVTICLEGIDLNIFASN